MWVAVVAACMYTHERRGVLLFAEKLAYMDHVFFLKARFLNAARCNARLVRICIICLNKTLFRRAYNETVAPPYSKCNASMRI